MRKRKGGERTLMAGVTDTLNRNVKVKATILYRHFIIYVIILEPDLQINFWKTHQLEVT